MSHHYELQIKDHSGIVQSVITQWDRLEFRHHLNDISTLTLRLDRNNPQVSNLLTDYQIEVWRSFHSSSVDIDRYKEWEGFIRAGVDDIPESGDQQFISRALGYNFLLAGRHILYPSGSSQAQKSAVAETVMKEFVDENAGPGATSPPRLLAAGAFSGLTIEADQARGSNWTGARAYRNLLSVLQEISEANGFDFGIVGTGAATFEFRAKPAPWGSDRSDAGLDPSTGLNGAGNAPVIFNLERGNVRNLTYTLNRMTEVNAAIALGQGIEDDREVIQRTDAAAIAVSPWNRREGTRQANRESATAGLNAIGDAMLDELKARETLDFAVLQGGGVFYGRDYFLGDLVTGTLDTDVNVDKKIVGVAITVAQGDEIIQLELEDV